MQKRRILKTAGVCTALFSAACLTMGCSFDPLSYMSRNACEFFNCDELFFIEDIFPLSAGPTGDATGGMDMGEDDDGGH